MKIDIGCGGKKKEGFIGLDQYLMPGVDHVLDIGAQPWPFADESVDEAYSSNFLEHLTNLGERFERAAATRPQARPRSRKFSSAGSPCTTNPASSTTT